MAIPSGLRALLSQMGLVRPGVGQGEGGMQTKASAMKGAKGPTTGEALGEDGLLLTGLGYSGRDKHTDRKNMSERSNLTRFFQEQLREFPGPRTAMVSDEAQLQAAEFADGPAGEAQGEGATEGEVRDAPAEQQEMRAQDRREDARVQGQKEAAETAEARESTETSEAEQQQQQHDEDEEDKPGAGWVAEEMDEEGDERKRALRDPDALGQADRCRGELEDGTRCLRKAADGTPYCAEHAAQWQVPAPVRRGTIDE